MRAAGVGRPGAILAYDLCGNPTVTAEAGFVDYPLAVALAQGSECPPFPESELPAAECYIAPCSE